jgi:hypothetical protein
MHWPSRLRSVAGALADAISAPRDAMASSLFALPSRAMRWDSWPAEGSVTTGYRLLVTEDVAALLTVYDSLRPHGWRCPIPTDSSMRDGPIYRSVGQSRGEVLTPAVMHLDDSGLSDLIRRQQCFFAERGEAFTWKTHSYDEPALGDRLEALGFVAEECATVLVGAIGSMPKLDRPLPDGVTVRRMTTRLEVDRVASMQSEVGQEQEIWQRDAGELTEDLMRMLDSAPSASLILAAESRGEVVSSAWVSVKPEAGVAELSGAATRPGWRGHGIYQNLVVMRADFSASAGAGLIYTDASEFSLPILTKMGLTPVTESTVYVWKPQD